MGRKKSVTPETQQFFGIFTSDLVTMRQLQDDYINWVLSKCDDDLDKTAEILGITSRTIYNRVKHGSVKINTLAMQRYELETKENV